MLKKFKLFVLLFNIFLLNFLIFGYSIAGGDEIDTIPLANLDFDVNDISSNSKYNTVENNYKYIKPIEPVSITFELNGDVIVFKWTKSKSEYFEFYKLVYSGNNEEVIYSGNEYVVSIEDINKNLIKVSKQFGYRRLCFIYNGFYENGNKENYRNCSNVVKIEDNIKNIIDTKLECENIGGTWGKDKCITLQMQEKICKDSGNDFIDGICFELNNNTSQTTKNDKILDVSSGELVDQIIEKISKNKIFDDIQDYRLYKFFNVEKPNDFLDLKNKLLELEYEELENINNNIVGIVLDLLDAVENLYIDIEDKNDSPSMSDLDKMKTKIISIEHFITSNLDQLYTKTQIFDQTDFAQYVNELVSKKLNEIEIYINLHNLESDNESENQSGDINKENNSKRFQANILGGNVGLTLLVVLISIITVVVFMFLMSHFKNKKNGVDINIKNEVELILKEQNNIKSSKKYINNLIDIYKNISATGYIVEPIFLKNFIISMKIRGFIILLGGNGVGKTAFIESFVKAIYAEKFKKYYQKVIVKFDMDDEKKFLGLYDRLNNNYIDPNGITQLIANAYWDRDNPYFILLDEINTQDIEKYFPYFIDFDKILTNRESDFIKVGELSEADSKELKQAKINLIKQYNFIIQKEERIYEFGYRIPDNLYIIGTANVDKAVEPFTGKVLDRADVIKVKYMGDQDYKEQEQYIKDKSIDLIRDKDWLTKNLLDEKTLEYVKEICEIMSLSKRTDKSLCYFALTTINYSKLGISQAIKQKVLSKAYGPEYKEKLEKFLEISEKYKDQLDLQEAIDAANEMLKDDFVNFWKLT